MDIHNKISTIDDIKSYHGSDVVLCYGHFNLIHPGHLRYLQHAKSLAKTLIVAVKSDEELDNGLFGEHFLEMERAEGVAGLQIVDAVIVLNQVSLDQLIGLIGPATLVLGREFSTIHSKSINLAIDAVQECGKVVFHAGETHYATSNLLHNNVLDIETENKKIFRKICKNYQVTPDVIRSKISQFSESKLLVIWDTIVDNYVACDAIGMSAEAPVLVVKELENREFIGGAAIVASHVKALGAGCHYISVVGKDSVSSVVKQTLEEYDIGADLFVDPSRPTTYKTRYMVESQKLFRVSRIKDHKISDNIEQLVIDRLYELAPSIDGIMISDFVYGVISPAVLDAIISISKQYDIKLFGDLQCSSQVGKVTKFREFDLITPTEREARIALDDNENGVEWVANTLLKDTRSKSMLMKLGPDGFIAYNNNLTLERQSFPALAANPVDVTGAGDSLFAAMSVSLTSGASLMEASAIGSCMASLAVKEVGNIPITGQELKDYMLNILKE